MQLKHPLPAASPLPTPYHTGPSHSQTQPSQPIHESAAATVPLSSMTSLPCQVTTSAQARITPDSLVRMHTSVTMVEGDYRAHHKTTPSHKVTDRRPQAPLPSSPPLTTAPLDLTMVLNLQLNSSLLSPCFMSSHYAPFLHNPSNWPSMRLMKVIDLCKSDSLCC